MKVEIPSEEFSAVAGPLLTGAVNQLGARLAGAAADLAKGLADGYMDKEQAAAYLGIKERALENWMRPVAEGGRGVPHSKIGETVRFKRARIDAWMLSLEVNTPPVLRPLMEEAA